MSALPTAAGATALSLEFEDNALVRLLCGTHDEHLARIDKLVEQGIEQGRMPGCVVTVGHKGAIVFCKAYGNRSLRPEKSPMTTDTVLNRSWMSIHSDHSRKYCRSH